MLQRSQNRGRNWSNTPGNAKAAPEPRTELVPLASPRSGMSIPSSVATMFASIGSVAKNMVAKVRVTPISTRLMIPPAPSSEMHLVHLKEKEICQVNRCAVCVIFFAISLC